MKVFFAHLAAMLVLSVCFSVQAQTRPNIVFVMADDLGWGDVGFNGNTIIKTPHLDEMASQAVQFTRFYAAAPVCSPTRGSVLTGRNAERYGIYFANVGHLRADELTLAEMLRGKGYRTGHFGKWHLGTLTQTQPDGHRGGKEKFRGDYAPPWDHGFDVCFSTEQAVPTWNPMQEQTIPTKFWTGPDTYATENLDGDASRVVMDRAIPFIDESVRMGDSFFAVIWLYAPHTPVVAGPDYLAMYPNASEDQRHYYGCITAMDEQIGRFRRHLRELGIHDNTIVLFVSDNGPAGEGGGIVQYPGKRQQGSAGPFRGRKGSLYEGGIRVPALLEWPAVFTSRRKVDVPVTTSDYLPGIANLVGASAQTASRTLDGIDIFALSSQENNARPTGIGFRSYQQIAYIENRYKLYSPDDGARYELYDMVNDPYEKTDLSPSHPGIVKDLKHKLNLWLESCREDGTKSEP